jgi:glycogen debranching enzyme
MTKTLNQIIIFFSTKIRMPIFSVSDFRLLKWWELINISGNVFWTPQINLLQVLVVHRSSETSINQSGVIIRSDDRFLNLVVDSDSIVSNI